MTVERTHTTWFHFTKDFRYFSAVDEIREPYNDIPKVRGGYIGATPSTDIRFNEHNPLGKLPGSVWILDTQACLERIIKGWSPSGVCEACGEGRRPVVEKEIVPTQGPPEINRYTGHRDSHLHRWTGVKPMTGRSEVVVTGYACACPEPTAPTKPPSILISGFDATPLAVTA